MFVVMLISLSRAIVIIFPFYKINRRAGILSVVCFTFYHCTWNTVWFLSATENMQYYTIDGYCATYSEGLIDTLHHINYSICAGIPPVIVFLSFLASVANLRRQNLANASLTRKTHASITIAYFSALFIVCNLFTLLNSVLYTITMIRYKYPGPIYTNNFMFFYSWLLSELFCTVLNASLNPVLYFWRMKGMRLWVLGLFRLRPSSESVQVTFIAT